MYFCPECSYSLDIAKTSGLENDNRKELSKPSDAIKRMNRIKLYKFFIVKTIKYFTS